MVKATTTGTAEAAAIRGLTSSRPEDRRIHPGQAGPEHMLGGTIKDSSNALGQG